MWGTATSEDNLAVSYQAKHSLTTQSLIILLGIYANEQKTYVHTKTCTQMLAAASFMVLKNWKHHESLQHGHGHANWSKEIHTAGGYTREWHSLIKRNGLLIHAPAWTNLKCTPLSQRSQTLKAAYDILEKANYRDRKQISVCQDRWSGEWLQWGHLGEFQVIQLVSGSCSGGQETRRTCHTHRNVDLKE